MIRINWDWRCASVPIWTRGQRFENGEPVSPRAIWEVHCQREFGRSVGQQSKIMDLAWRYGGSNDSPRNYPEWRRYGGELSEWMVEFYQRYKNPKRLGKLRLDGTWWFSHRYWFSKGLVDLAEALSCCRTDRSAGEPMRVVNLRTGQIIML